MIDFQKKLYIFVEMSKRKNENELEEHEKPSTKRQRFKSGPANQKFLPLYHELWQCLERSDKGDTFAKCTVCNSHHDHASPGHDFITSKSRSKHGDRIMRVIEHIYLLYIFIVFIIFFFL